MLWALSTEELIGAIGAAVVVVLNAVIGAWVLLADKRQSRTQESNRTALDESFRIIDSLKQGAAAAADELRTTRPEREACRVKAVRATDRVRVLEDLLQRNNVPLDTWKEEPPS